MFPLFLRRVVSLGLVWLGTALPPATAVFAQESKQEHILFQAIRRGDTELLRGALRAGTPPDVRASDGTTPLMAAALHGSARWSAPCWTRGPIRARPARPESPPCCGAPGMQTRSGCCSSVAPIRMLAALGNTPLMVAAGSPTGSAAIEQLLAAKADITLRNKGGRTALRFAAGGGDVRTVRLLLEKAKSMGQLPEVVRAAGPSLAIAASDGFPDIVELLLAHGADPNQANGTRGHGLNAALLAGHTDIARNVDRSRKRPGQPHQPGRSSHRRTRRLLGIGRPFDRANARTITARISVLPTRTARPLLPGPGCAGTAG